MTHEKVWIAILLSGLCAASDIEQKPGLIASDRGGASGYQHGLKQSHFALGKESRPAEEKGWSKQTGPEGAFAVNRHNGMVLAIPSANVESSPQTKRILDYKKQNDEVQKYFVSAGIPEDQIAEVHALTLLSSSGSREEQRAASPKIDGYLSVLVRKVGGYPVPDSVAWAQMDEEGKIITEAVYWPAIPAKALNDAKRLTQMLATSEKSKLLAHVPSELPQGEVVIRHSSASMLQGTFEVLASYDVQERRVAQEPSDAKTRGRRSGVVITRHFDVDGVERQLPQERRNAEKEFPTRPKTPPPSSSQVSSTDSSADASH